MRLVDATLTPIEQIQMGYKSVIMEIGFFGYVKWDGE